jgi:hypothetical protein
MKRSHSERWNKKPRVVLIERGKRCKKRKRSDVFFLGGWKSGEYFGYYGRTY